MHHHIKRLKAHRNALYGIVVVLLILQIVSFASMSSQASKIIAQQEDLQNSFDSQVSELKVENQAVINEIIEALSAQKTDLEKQINLLKASQDDFSGVIEDVVRGVVSIRTDRSVGSGFLVDPRGYIVTNYHVINGANQVRVSLYDGQEFDATVINGDVFMDIAVLKIPGFFDFLEFADSEGVQPGTKVIAIGNPLGLSFTVTEGIVSAVDREGPNGLDSYIQTDVTLNPGNSGGPLIDKTGKVVGVNNFKIGGAESLGFALEGEIVKQKVEEFLNPPIEQ